MKLTLVVAVTALGLALCRVLPEFPPFVDEVGIPIDPSSNFSVAWTSQNLPRAANDELWNKCRIKGCNLIRAMLQTDQEAGYVQDPPTDSVQSKFKDFPHDIIEWGYNFLDTGSSPPNMLTHEALGIEDALKGLGVSSKLKIHGGHNEQVYYVHKDPEAKDAKGPIPLPLQTYPIKKPDGSIVNYPMTGAYFDITLNVKDGVIMMLHRKSPKEAAAYNNLNVPDDKLPELHKSSDIAFGMWKIVTDQNKSDIKNIKYFFCIHVVNIPTLKIVARALNGEPLKPWPGKRFLTQQWDGGALMGTPNGVGIAYFLIQHKADLGLKHVWAIDVFHCNDKDQRTCLLFHVN